MNKFFSDLWELLAVMANVSPYTPPPSNDEDSPSRGVWDATSTYYPAYHSNDSDN
jgi:hypothetical protein